VESRPVPFSDTVYDAKASTQPPTILNCSCWTVKTWRGFVASLQIPPGAGWHARLGKRHTSTLVCAPLTVRAHQRPTPSAVNFTRLPYKQDAGHLKSVGSWHKDNSGKVLTTTTSLRRYGFIEVFRKHSSLILCFPIFNQSNIGEDSKILNYSGIVIFEVSFAKPYFWCVLCKQNEIGWLQMPGTIGLFPQVQSLPSPQQQAGQKILRNRVSLF